MDETTAELEALERILIDATAEPIMLSYTLLKLVTKNFSEEIGSGGFGVVYMGTLKKWKVAVKVLSKTDEFSEKQFEDEVTCLIRVKHKNIVRFLGYCSDTQRQVVQYSGNYVLADVRRRLLCFEYVPNKSLHDYLKDETSGCQWNVRLQLIKGICQGLRYLHHEERICHLDLKPENILLDADMIPKITDFGLSRRFGGDQSRMFTKNIYGSPGNIAREYIDKGEISFKSDIFSLGIIIIKILKGSNDFPDIENWHKSLGADCPEIKRCVEVAKTCVEDDQHKRPTIVYIIDKLNDKETRTDMVSTLIAGSGNNGSSSVAQVTSDRTEFLVVDPLELHFAFELKKPISCSLKLTNKTDGYIAFKWRVTHPTKYCTKPNKGIIRPHSILEVVVIMQAQKEAPPNMQCNDKFLLQSTQVTEGFTTEDISADTFSEKTGNVVNELKFKVLYVTPSQ